MNKDNKQDNNKNDESSTVRIDPNFLKERDNNTYQPNTLKDNPNIILIDEHIDYLPVGCSISDLYKIVEDKQKKEETSKVDDVTKKQINLQNLKRIKENEEKAYLELKETLLKTCNSNTLKRYTESIAFLVLANDLLAEKDNVDEFIGHKFVEYLLKDGKTETTAYDYLKRVERIAKNFGQTLRSIYRSKNSLKFETFYCKEYYIIDDLIELYSKQGPFSDVNISKHNAPLSSLKAFKSFMKNTSYKFDEDSEITSLYKKYKKQVLSIYNK